MSRSVIAGLDESPESAAAVDWAAREALLRDVPLRLVHASNWPVGVTRPADGAEQRWAEDLLAAAADRLHRAYPAIRVTTRWLPGRPSAVLAAEAAGADLLVLGSRGLGRLMGFALGSVGLGTLAAAEPPVVLVRAPQPTATGTGDTDDPDDTAGRPGDVVVGVDIRQLCDPLLEFAFGEAARLGCRVRAVHAWTLPPLVREASALMAAEQDLTPGVERGLAAVLAHWERQYPSVPVVALAPVGPAAPVLVRAAAGAELVVVGRRSRRPTLGAHIGPVTHAVVHHCAAPVAVVAHR